MLYDAYRTKIVKASAVRHWIKRFRVPIIAVLCVLVGSLAAFLGLKGTITTNVSISAQQIYYGEAYELNDAKALFGSIKGYEFSKVGEDKWSETKPSTPGDYYVRALAKGSFGQRKSTAVQFTIKPRPVQLTVTDTQLEYGENPKNFALNLNGSAERGLVNSDEIVKNKLIYTFDDLTSMQTSVSVDTESIQILDKSGADVTEYYAVKAEKTEISFTARPLVIRPRVEVRVYDGKPVAVVTQSGSARSIADGDTYSPELCEDTLNGLKFDPEIQFESVIYDENGNAVSEMLNAGVYRITVDPDSVKITLDGKDVTALYDFKFEESTFTVQPRDITVTTGSADKIYDGTPLTAAQLSEEEGLLASLSQTVSLKDGTAPCSVIDTGSAQNVYSAKDFIVTDADGNDLTANYNINVVYGTLTVTPRKVYIRRDDVQTVYRNNIGDPVGIREWGFGSYWKYASSSQTEENQFVTVDGLTQIPEYIDTAFYQNGEKAIFENYLDAGAYIMCLESVSDYGENGFKKSNYEIIDAENERGTITVTARTVFVKASDRQLIYDGQNRSYTGYCEFENGNPVGNPIIIWKYLNSLGEEVEPIDAGEYTIRLASVAESEGDSFKLSNYNILEVEGGFGTLTIIPRTVYIKAIDCEVTYDGEKHRVKELLGNDDWEYGENVSEEARFVEGESPVFYWYYLTTPVNADVYYVYLAGYEDNGAFKSSNYEIYELYNRGTLTIKQRHINVYTGSAERAYNGELLYNYDEYSAENLVDGHEIAHADEGICGIINVETVNNVYDFIVKNADGEDITFNYEIEYEYGTLTVTPRKVYIRRDNVQAVYGDRIWLSDWGFGTVWKYATENEENHFVTTYGLTEIPDHIDTALYLNGELVGTEYYLDAGEYVMRLSQVCPHGSNNFALSNYEIYDIEEEAAVLTIIPRGVTVKAYDITKTYDGMPYDGVIDFYCAYGTGFVENELPVISWKYVNSDGEEVEAADAGEYSIRISLVEAEGLNGFKLSNYNIGEYILSEAEEQYGKLTVQKRTAYAAALNVEKIYDGKTYEEEIGFIGTNLVDEQTPVIKWIFTNQDYEGFEPVDAGEYSITIYSVEAEGLNGFKLSNYDIYDGEPIGTLTIIPRTVYIKAKACGTVYDGKEHTVKELLGNDDWEYGEYDSEEAHFVEGESPVFSWYYEGAIYGFVTPMNADIYNVYLAGYEDNGAFKASNYLIYESDGVENSHGPLTISPRKVYIRRDNAQAVYGDSVFDENISVFEYGFGTVWKYASLSQTEDNQFVTINGLTQTPYMIATKFVQGGKYFTSADLLDSGEYVLRLEYVSDYGENGFMLSNYDISDIEEECGILTVSPRTVYIAAKYLPVTYNGEAWSHKDYHNWRDGIDWEYTDGGTFYAEEIPVINWKYTNLQGEEVQPIDAGDYFAHIASVGEEGLNGFKASNYEIYDGEPLGKLTILPRDIWVVSKYCVFTYDGEEHDIKEKFGNDDWDYLYGVNGYEFVGGQLPVIHWKYTLNGEEVIPVDAGYYGVLINYVEDEGINGFKLSNYNIQENEGTLHIEQRKVRIKAKDYETVYDGNEHGIKEAYGDDDWEYYPLDDDDLQFVGNQKPIFEWYYYNSVYGEVPVNAATYFIHPILPVADNGDFKADNYIVCYYTGESVGTLTITPREVTVRAENASKTYDGEVYGEEIKNTVTDGSFVGEEYPEIGWKFTNSQGKEVEPVDAGEYKIGLLFGNNTENGFKLSNYKIKDVSGTLTIGKRKVTVSPADGEKVYDGTDEYYVECTETYGSFVNGEKPLFVGEYDNEPVSKGSYAILSVTALEQEGGAFKAANYEITSSGSATLTIKARPVTFSSQDGEKTYDGEAFEHVGLNYIVNGYECGLVSGQRVEVYNRAVIVNVRDSKAENNTFEVRIFAGSENVTVNYEITPVYGTVTIIPKEITVTTVSDDSFVYNGQAHFNHSGSTDGLVAGKGHVLVLDTSCEDEFASITEVGSTPNTLYFYVKCDNEGICTNYNILYSYGTLTVKPRKINVTTGSANRDYNGSPLSDYDGYSADNLVDGHKIVHADQTVVSITNVGSIKNEYIFNVEDAAGNDVTKNYSITYNYGNLTVTPRKVTVKAENASKPYDGNAFDGEIEFNCTDGTSFVKNEEPSINWKFKNSQYDGYAPTDAGDYDILYDGATKNGVFDPANYTINQAAGGKLTINKLTVQVKANDYNAGEYDGNKHFLKELGYYDWAYAGSAKFVGGQIPEITWKYTNSKGEQVEPLNAGDYTVKMVSVAEEGYNGFKLSNYNVLENGFGTLTIEKRRVTVQPYGTKVYDGTADAQINCSAISGSFVSGERPEFKVSADDEILPDVGSYALTAAIAQLTPTFNPDNYDIKFEKGEFVITSRPISFSSATGKSKTYNGEAIDGGSILYTPSGEGVGLVKGHSFEISDRAVIVNVRDSKAENNSFEVKIFADGKDVTANYEIAKYFGTLTINPKEITVTTASDDSFVYDGNEHSKLDGYSAEGIIEGKGHVLVRDTSSYTSITNAGSTPNILSFRVECENEGVCTNYTIKYKYGTLTVQPRTVRIAVQNATKVYDGTPDVEINFNDISTGENEGFIGSQRPFIDWVFTQNGRQVSPVDAGEYTVGWGEDLNDIVGYYGQYGFIKDNYNLEAQDTATLIISVREIVFKAVDNTYNGAVYDGKALSANSYGFTTCLKDDENQSGLVSADPVNVTFAIFKDGKEVSELLSAGTYTVKIAGISGLSDNYLYDLSECEDVEITVHKRAVTIKLLTGSRDYDGSYTDYTHLIALNNGVWYSLRSAGSSIISGDSLFIGEEFTQDMFCFDGKAYENLNSVTDSDSYVISPTQRLFENLNPNYDVTVQNGSYNIKKITLNIRFNDFTAEYTGEDITVPTSEDVMDIDENVRSVMKNMGHELSFEQTTVVRNVQKGDYNYKSVLSVDITDKNGDSCKHNYNVSITAGKIIVEPAQLTVTVNAQTRYYNGNAMQVEYTVGGLLGGQQFNVTGWKDRASGQPIIHAGDYNDYEASFTITLNGSQYDGSAKYPYKNNYSITYVLNTLTVAPRVVTVKPFGEKVYDGTQEIIISGIYPEGTDDGHKFLKGEQPAFEYVIEGEHANARSYEVNAVTNQINSDYEIVYEAGTFTVTPREVWIKVYGEKVYDGTAVCNVRYEYVGKSLKDAEYQFVGSQNPLINSTLAQTDAGKYPVNSENTAVEDNGDFLKTNYTVHFEEGNFEIHKRKITVTTGSDEQVYNGTPLTSDEFDYDKQNGDAGLITGHVISKKADDSLKQIINVRDTADHNNVCEVNISAGGESVTHNYDIDYVYGTLTITPAALKVKTEGATKVYDGTNSAEIIWTVAEGTVYAGVLKVLTGYETASGTTYIQPKNAGEYNLLCGGGQDNGDFIASNYTITASDDNNGVLKIDKRKVEIVLQDSEKTFDGTENAEMKYTFASTDKDKQFVNGEYPKFIWNFSATPFMPGEYTGSYGGVSDRGSFKVDNYEVTCGNTAKLTVCRDIRLAPYGFTQEERIYSGTALISVNGAIGGWVCDGLYSYNYPIYGFTFGASVTEIVYDPDGAAQKVSSAVNAGTYRIYYGGISYNLANLPEFNDWESVGLNVLNEKYFDVTIIKRKINVKLNDAQIEYNGATEYFLGTVNGACGSATATVFDSTLADGHTFIVDKTESLNASKSAAWAGILAYRIIDAGGNNVTANYSVVTSPEGTDYIEYDFKGQLSFNKTIINVTRLPVSANVPEEDRKFVYTGEDIKVNYTSDWGELYSLDENTPLMEGHEIAVVAEIPASVPGMKYAWLKVRITDSNGKDVSGLYTVVYSYAEGADMDDFAVEVVKARLEITASGNTVTSVKVNGANAVLKDGYFELLGGHRLSAELADGGFEIYTIKVIGNEQIKQPVPYDVYYDYT